MPARVQSIDPPDGTVFPVQTISGGGYEGERPLEIRVRFSKGLRSTTVTNDSFAVTMRPMSRHVETGVTYGDPRTIAGEVTYDADSHTATFVPEIGEFAHVVNSAGIIIGEFTIPLSTTGAVRIIDEDGMVLDGDRFVGPGGDFYSNFVVELGPY